MKRMIDTKKLKVNSLEVESITDSNGNSYQPIEDVSNQIENTAEFDITFLKAYKIGKMVFINLQVTNNGDQINANTTIFTLSEELSPVNNIVGYARISASNSTFVIVPTGEISVINNIASSGVLSLMISYPVE